MNGTNYEMNNNENSFNEKGSWPVMVGDTDNNNTVLLQTQVLLISLKIDTSVQLSNISLTPM